MEIFFFLARHCGVEMCVRNLCWPFSSACEAGHPPSFPHFVHSETVHSDVVATPSLLSAPWLWLVVDLSPKLNFLLPTASPCCPLPATFVFIWPTSQGTHSYLWLSRPGSRVRCACQAFSLWLSPAPKLNCSVTSCHPGSTTSPSPLSQTQVKFPCVRRPAGLELELRPLRCGRPHSRRPKWKKKRTIQTLGSWGGGFLFKLHSEQEQIFQCF